MAGELSCLNDQMIADDSSFKPCHIWWKVFLIRARRIYLIPIDFLFFGLSSAVP
jgi:hypothetical protein